MRLTPFGEIARTLRMRSDLSLKSMADFMGISSSHLSGIEYGDKRLSDTHVESAVSFFTRHRATREELAQLRDAAAKSKDLVDTSQLAPDARGLVAAFARRLQDGAQPPESLERWIMKKKEPGE